MLDIVVPYFDGGEDTVFNHIYQGMIHLTTDVGKRGLTLFRRSDWNDSTNGAGNLGRGESVWLSQATIRALKIFAELCDKVGKQDIKNEILKKCEKMTANVLKYGIVNGHFIHGYDDWDNIIGGGEEDEEGSFCLNMQTWAVLSDVCDKEFQNEIMDEVEKKLKCPFGYVLNDPPYTHPKQGVGRTSYFMPGTVENASVYIHGSMFKAIADCMLDRGDNAYQTICSVLYPNNTNSGVEPYAVSNMLIGPSCKTRSGDAPMSWVTGSAGWMYRALTEFILGVRADYDGLIIDPKPPKDWTEFSVKRLYRGAEYDIKLKKTNRFKIFIDDKELQGNKLPVIKSGQKCAVRVEF